MRSLSIATLLLLSPMLAFAEDADRAFTLRVGGHAINGPEPVDLSGNTRVFTEIANGTAFDVKLTWRPAREWRLALGYERAVLRYVDPQLDGCALAVGNVVGSDFCQAIGFQPQGTIDDKTRQWQVALGRSIVLDEQLSLDIDLGYRRLTWQADRDLEASTFSSCLTQGLPGWTRRAPNCVPVNDRARASSWALDLALRWQATTRLGVAVGGHAQRYRHDIYRYDALGRFLAAQPRPCDPFDRCNRPPEQFNGGRAVQRGNWWWYTAALDFVITPSWSVIAEGEFGGSRDWRTAGLALAYHW